MTMKQALTLFAAVALLAGATVAPRAAAASLHRTAALAAARSLRTGTHRVRHGTGWGGTSRRSAGSCGEVEARSSATPKTGSSSTAARTSRYSSWRARSTKHRQPSGSFGGTVRRSP